MVLDFILEAEELKIVLEHALVTQHQALVAREKQHFAYAVVGEQLECYTRSDSTLAAPRGQLPNLLAVLSERESGILGYPVLKTARLIPCLCYG